MARRFAQVPVMIWGRDSFRSLSQGAQRLYFLLSTSPTTTLAGVADWRPKRLMVFSGNTTAKSLTDAMEELKAAGLVVTDEETEEVWLRPMIADDGLLRGPKTAAGVAAAWAGISSPLIRNEIAILIRDLIEEAHPSVRSLMQPVADYEVTLPLPVPKKVTIPAERKAPIPNRFEEWYAAYPRHASRAGAEKAYLSKVVNAKVDEQVVIDAARRYAVQRFGQDKTFTKMPETWLNKACWLDEEEVQDNGGGDVYKPIWE